MKIYTRTGDAGSTGLFGGPRVQKDDCRIEAYGTVDELSAAIGLARSAGLPGQVDGQLERVQHELFSIGGELASPNPDQHGLRLIDDSHVAHLEAMIDEHELGLPELKNFILPGGCEAAARLHVARVICRRAERRVVSLAAEAEISETPIVYLNRLSDYLFVASRVVNLQANVGEVTWVRPTSGH